MEGNWRWSVCNGNGRLLTVLYYLENITVKSSILLPALFIAVTALAQGHIENIRDQPYLKNASRVDCGNVEDMMSARICANLAFQRSDSVLTVYYDQLIADGDTSLVEVQALWRDFRDAHCQLVSHGSGNFGAIQYMSCLKELTDHRIEELKSMFEP